MYLDHHDRVRWDPTPDSRQARLAALPKVGLLIAAVAERDARSQIKAAVLRGEEPDDQALEMLTAASAIRKSAMAIP